MSKGKKKPAKNNDGDTANKSNSKCVCMEISTGKFRCFKRVLNNLVDCGFGEFSSAEACQKATGCATEDDE
jgi:hypothetical protein